MDANVTAAKIATDAVTTVKIMDANVTTAKIADANVTAAKLATDAVTTVKIMDANVTAAKLATDAVTTVKIMDANVTTAKIANAAVDTTKIAANGGNKVLATDGAGVVRWLDKTAVGTSVSDNITIQGTGAVGDSLKLKDGGVNTTQLADSAVTTAKLRNLSVTNAKLANAAVDSAKIASNAVNPVHIKGDAEKILVSQGGLTKWVTRLAPGESTAGSAAPALYNIAAPAADNLMVKVSCTGGIGTCNIATFSVPAGKIASFVSTGGVWEIIGIF